MNYYCNFTVNTEIIQMKFKSNTNNSEIQHRKVKIVEKAELNKWASLFSLFGYKKDCTLKTGVAPETIKRIIKTGKGIESTIDSIRAYYKSQQSISIK